MAFPTNKSGQQARWSDIQLVIDTLTGVSGGGDQIQLTQYNNSSNYALDVRNLDTTNGYGLRVRDGASANLLTVAKNAIGIGGSAADVLTLTGRVSAAALTHSPGSGVVGVLVNIGGTLTEFSGGTHARLSVMELAVPTITAGAGAVTDASTLYIAGPPAASGASNWALWIDTGATRLDGTVYIGDTANANLTLGLTINQAANDDEILALKSSDVAHGMTTLTETDTYGSLQKYNATQAGLQINGFSGGTTGIRLFAVHTSDDANKNINAGAAFLFDGSLRSGTTYAALGVNANIIGIRTGTTARFFLDGEGDSHQDVGTAWTEFDDYDDVALLDSLNHAVMAERDDPIRREFGAFLRYNKDALRRTRIVTFNEDGHHFVNMSKLSMLLAGAVRQLGQRLAATEAELADVKRLMLPSGG